MSASLVGSEMCIRDSRDLARASRARARARSRKTSAGAGRPPQAAQAYACLLYTSDAADDM
eukprot:2916925-Alexandrium_andersonii.AAC.1